MDGENQNRWEMDGAYVVSELSIHLPPTLMYIKTRWVDETPQIGTCSKMSGFKFRRFSAIIVEDECGRRESVISNGQSTGNSDNLLSTLLWLGISHRFLVGSPIQNPIPPTTF